MSQDAAPRRRARAASTVAVCVLLLLSALPTEAKQPAEGDREPRKADGDRDAKAAEEPENGRAKGEDKARRDAEAEEKRAAKEQAKEQAAEQGPASHDEPNHAPAAEPEIVASDEAPSLPVDGTSVTNRPIPYGPEAGPSASDEATGRGEAARRGEVPADSAGPEHSVEPFPGVEPLVTSPPGATLNVDDAPQVEDPPRAGPLDQPTPSIDVTESLDVARTPRGNLLQWEEVKELPGSVQVWRHQGGETGWAVIATLPASGTLVDQDASAAAQYKLSWSSQTAVFEGEPTMVPSPWVEKWQPALTKGPAGEVIGPSSGRIALGLLWLGIGLFGSMRAPAPGIPGGVVSLRGLLSRLPGMDDAAMRRVEARGLGSSAQLAAIDPDAVDFWAGLEPGTARSWNQLAELMTWPVLPAGAGERLARSGIVSIQDLAAAQPEALRLALADVAPEPGAIVPPEVEAWIALARSARGIAAPVVELRAAADVDTGPATGDLAEAMVVGVRPNAT